MRIGTRRALRASTYLLSTTLALALIGAIAAGPAAAAKPRPKPKPKPIPRPMSTAVCMNTAAGIANPRKLVGKPDGTGRVTLKEARQTTQRLYRAARVCKSKPTARIARNIAAARTARRRGNRALARRHANLALARAHAAVAQETRRLKRKVRARAAVKPCDQLDQRINDKPLSDLIHALEVAQLTGNDAAARQAYTRAHFVYLSWGNTVLRRQGTTVGDLVYVAQTGQLLGDDVSGDIRLVRTLAKFEQTLWAEIKKRSAKILTDALKRNKCTVTRPEAQCAHDAVMNYMILVGTPSSAQITKMLELLDAANKRAKGQEIAGCPQEWEISGDTMLLVGDGKWLLRTTARVRVDPAKGTVTLLGGSSAPNMPHAAFECRTWDDTVNDEVLRGTTLFGLSSASYPVNPADGSSVMPMPAMGDVPEGVYLVNAALSTPAVGVIAQPVPECADDDQQTLALFNEGLRLPINMSFYIWPGEHAYNHTVTWPNGATTRASGHRTDLGGEHGCGAGCDPATAGPPRGMGG